MPFLPQQFPRRLGRADVFWPTGNAHAYEIPDEASALLIVAVGGAGGGGAGFSAAAAAARGGGGGGGSGAVTRAVVPVISLPRVLYVSPGFGGNPAAAGGASFVGAQNTSVATSNVIFANGGGAGGTGTGAAVGAAGSAGAVATILNVIYSWLSPHEYTVGIAGATGGAIAGGAGTAAPWGNLGICGGAGGGGTTSADFAGGNITGSGLIPTISGGAAGSNDGRGGYWDPVSFISTGGSGGGSSNAGVGGNGGSGGPGSGGGGGGGGTTGGTGGRGGNGYIIIQPL